MLTFYDGRTCVDCGTPLPDPTSRGQPPKRCVDCRERPQRSRQAVKAQPAPIPDYGQLGEWLEVRLPW
jgi:hypothetical protein